MLYKVLLTFESVDEILKCDIQMKGVELYFPVVLFIMLYKMFLTFEYLDEILNSATEYRIALHRAQLQSCTVCPPQKCCAQHPRNIRATSVIGVDTHCNFVTRGVACVAGA